MLQLCKAALRFGTSRQSMESWVRWSCGQRLVNFVIQILNSVHGYHHHLHAVLNFNGVFQFLGQTGIIESNRYEGNISIKFVVLHDGWISFSSRVGVWEGLVLRQCKLKGWSWACCYWHLGGSQWPQQSCCALPVGVNKIPAVWVMMMWPHVYHNQIKARRCIVIIV